MNAVEIKKRGFNYFKSFVKSDDVLKDLRNFVHSRNKAFIAKEVLKKSHHYTDNRIIQQNRFTNLKREWDITTRNLLKVIDGKSMVDKLMNIIWYRAFRIKREPFFIDFLNSDKCVMSEMLRLINEDDETNSKSNGAYMISVTNRTLNNSKMNPIEYFQYNRDEWEQFFLVDVVKGYEIIPVKGLPSLGRFFIYQIMIDLTYQDEYPLTENDFVITGPGCERGLDELFHNFKSEGLTYDDLLRVVWVFSKLFLDVKDWDDFFVCPDGFPMFQKEFSLANVENLFCEFHKYMKIKRASGTNIKVKTRKYGN